MAPQIRLRRVLRSPVLRLVPAAALAVAVCLLPACDDAGGSSSSTATPASKTTTTAKPAAPPKVAVTSEGAQITFDRVLHDFGRITDTASHKTSFSFHNTGREKLVISEVKAACGCTVPTMAKTVYESGEGGTIDITFDPKGKQGPTKKYITVVSNSDTDGAIQLTLDSQIKPLLEFERMHRLGRLTLGQEHTNILETRYFDPELVFRSITTNNPHLSAELIESGDLDPASDGDPAYVAKIQITVSKDAPWGLIYATRATINVQGRPEPSSNPVYYTYDAFLTGEVFGDLTCNPTILSVGPLPPNQTFEKSTTIARTSGAPFIITSARVEFDDVPSQSAPPTAQVQVDTIGTGMYRVRMSGNAGPYTGAIRGRLIMETDVADESELVVRFSGLVKQ